MTNNVDISKRPFLDVMGAEVTALAKKFCLEGSKVFLLWFAKLAFDLSEDEAYESVLIDGPNDKSIDLFWVDDFANRVIVAQGKYSKTGSSKPKDNSVDSLLSSIDWLAQPEMLEREGKPELAEAARAYREAVDKEYSTELWFVYCVGQRTRTSNSVFASTTPIRRISREGVLVGIATLTY